MLLLLFGFFFGAVHIAFLFVSSNPNGTSIHNLASRTTEFGICVYFNIYVRYA